ncbi:MAG TPA: ATP-binding cassette domain-containing protein, partial [Candidatus Eisenbacteria bacterium]
NLKLPEPERSGRIVLDVKDLGKSYGDLTVLDGISFRLQRGDKMGVIGVNGAGKSTLLRLIVGQEAYDRGELRLGAGVEIGYFEQEQKALRGPHSVLDEAWKVTPLVPENEIRTFLGGFLFSGEDVYKPLNALSGGERSRLALALIVRSRANFLVLDEPTNHLDIPSRAVFEAAVEQFEGTVLTVSHDRWFLDRTVNQILAIDNGHAVLSLGNYSDYRRRHAPVTSVPAVPAAAPPKPPTKTEPKTAANPSVSAPKVDKRARERWQKELARLEEAIAVAEVDKSRIGAELESGAIIDRAQLAERGKAWQAAEDKLAALMAEWEKLQAREVTGA